MHPDEAIAVCEKVLKIDPDHANSHNTLGFAYYEQGNYDEAIAEWKETIRLEPDHANAHKNLGLVYSDLGRTEEAIAAFEAYLRLRPDAPDRDVVEDEIVELQGAAGQAVEYSNAEGGYGLHYPSGWYYAEDGPQAEFAESEEMLDTAGDENLGVMFNAGPLDELAESLGLTDTTDPVAVWEAMAESLGVEGDEIESFNNAGYPAAAADISGTASGASFEGAMVIVLVDERIVYAIALSPPDQWAGYRSTFVDMINSLTFFEPQE